MADKKLSAEESQKFLLVLLNEPENKNCADCHAKGPRWASANLGVFVCIKCSGIHRSLGVHISQVRSVSLDKWTPEQLETMKRVGNAKAAELYEAALPDNFRRPSENETYALEQFIREKYERKLYFRKSSNNSSQHKSAPTSKSTPSNNHPSKSTSNSKPAPPKVSNPVQQELIQWETNDTTPNNTTHSNHNNNFGLEFTSFTGANTIGDDIEFSGFQSASTSVNNSNILQSPRHAPSNNIDAESAFFSGVTTNAPVNTSISNAPKPSKDAILQLYNQPISGGITSNTYMGHQPGTTGNMPHHQANYNVRMPSLGLGTGGVTMATPPVGYNMSGPTMYTNNPMMMQQPQPQGGMYSTMPPGYVNPMAANMMMNSNVPTMPTAMPSNYVNPNYLKMMNGGVNSNTNNMNNRPLFN